MEVKITEDYRIVIPEEARERLHIEPGQRLQVIAEERMIILVPVGSLKDMKGMFPNLTTDNIRDEDDRI